MFTGRTEDATDGIYVHPNGFRAGGEGKGDRLPSARTARRETAFSRDYDELYDLLRHERDHGKIVWVMGPAFAFDHDARRGHAAKLIDNGYCPRPCWRATRWPRTIWRPPCLHTALGQDIYTQRSAAERPL